MFRFCASLLLLLLLCATAAAEAPVAEPPPAGAQSPSAEPEPEPEPEPAPSAPAPAPEGPLLQSDGVDGNLSLKEATERGIRLFKEGNYDGAVQAFTAAYVLSPKPMFLFNIAQAHRKAGRPQEALLSYQLFLRKAPETPLRAETEAYIELVRTQLQARPPEPAKPPPAVTPLLAAPAAVPSKAEARVPLYRRAWTWIVVGAAVAVTTGVAVGVYLGTRPPPTTLSIVEPTF
jgi:tetratricopeptide (TPR) repeat protein